MVFELVLGVYVWEGCGVQRGEYGVKLVWMRGSRRGRSMEESTLYDHGGQYGVRMEEKMEPRGE